jgi:hypothetical protein
MLREPSYQHVHDGTLDAFPTRPGLHGALIWFNRRGGTPRHTGRDDLGRDPHSQPEIESLSDRSAIILAHDEEPTLRPAHRSATQRDRWSKTSVPPQQRVRREPDLDPVNKRLHRHRAHRPYVAGPEHSTLVGLVLVTRSAKRSKRS